MNGNEINLVIGIVGHVGHGKTALIEALTGTDTNRLKEEKERGMTIESGFASMRLPSGNVLSIVDVPGHELFVKNMLRGISGIDVAILVVASDEGLMPQTREHFDILRLLNIRYGLIVISKIDLVDEETLYIANEEVRDLVKGTFFENASVIPFSAKTGQGLEEIHRSIEDISKQVVEKDQGGVFRLPIDRVFSMAGYGTIVTGTIASGKIQRGDNIQIYPNGKITSIRNIQIHNQWVYEAMAGHRVGLNLSDVRVDDLERGMVLGELQSLLSTNIINAKFQYLQSNSYPLNDRIEVKFHSGTYEVIARVILMGRDSLRPGEGCFVQLRLEDKVALLPYDRYIIRSLSPMITIGGGVILEINPEKYRTTQTESIGNLELLERRINHEMVEALIRKERLGSVKCSELARKLHLSQKEIDKARDHLLKEGRILMIEDGSVIHKESIIYLEKEMLENIAGFHESHPDQKDVSQEEIRLKISLLLNQRIYETILQDLKNKKEIEINKGRIKLSGFQVTLNKKQKQIYDRLEEVCRSYHVRPLPSNILTMIMDSYGEREVEMVLKLMVSEGNLIKLNNHRLIHAEAMDDVKRRVQDHIAKRGQIALKDSQEVFGLGRPQVQPIFDYLDSIRFTMRIGDYRVLYKNV